jgi:hypothetical protein
MTSLSQLSVDELADGICLRAGRIAAAEADLLTWIGEFDERDGWAGHGLLSCAHWLSWKLGLSPGAARERVRVAGTLRELPAVAEAFGQGLMSWSQVRALTRVARPDDGIDWVMIARSSSGAQIEKIVRGMRRAQSLEEAKEDCEHAAWLVRTRKTYDADGNLVMTIYAKAEIAPVVMAAFDAKRDEIEREREAAAEHDVPAGTSGHCCELHRRRARWQSGGDVPAGTPAGDETHVPRISDGDALLAMAQDVLCKETPTADTARRNRFRMTANVDPLSGWGRLRDGELLPPTSLQSVMKTLAGKGGTVRLRPVTAADLRRFDLGRSQRDVSTNLRELVGTIDGERCRFPGCTRHQKLHAHHVVYWSQGGGTDFDNVVLLCSRHHTLVHNQGFRLVLHPDRRLDVMTAHGAQILHLPTPPWGDPAALDPAGRIDVRTITPPYFEPGMDLGYVVNVLLTQAS